MRKALVSFPGRAGDLLWACCAIRSLSELWGVPIDLQIAGEFEGLVPLLAQQSYLGRVWADPDWSMGQSRMSPTTSRGDGQYDFSADIGYLGWPTRPLPLETWDILAAQVQGELPPLDLTRPWITVGGLGAPTEIACGWSDCHFELKVGLMELLSDHFRTMTFPPRGSRWDLEHPYGVNTTPCGWEDAARGIKRATVFLGDCSALHVLAVAMGKPVVVMEPMTARLDPIFWPLGKDGPQVTLVRGNDGEMTTDARHTADVLKAVLNAR